MLTNFIKVIMIRTGDEGETTRPNLSVIREVPLGVALRYGETRTGVKLLISTIVRHYKLFMANNIWQDHLIVPYFANFYITCRGKAQKKKLKWPTPSLPDSGKVPHHATGQESSSVPDSKTQFRTASNQTIDRRH